MPAKTELTWEPATRRWRKVYRGRTYTVSCRALGVPHTKQESYQAANAWWLAKRAEIDRLATPHPNAQHLELLSRRLAWAEDHGRRDLVQRLNEVIEEVSSDQSGQLDGRYTGPNDLTSMVSDTIDNSIWEDRLTVDSVSTIPEDCTIGAQVTRYLGLQRTRTENGQLSISEYDTIRRCLETLRGWIGGSNHIKQLDAERWEAWWSHLITQDISTEYKKKRFRIARTFVSWLAEKGLISVPPTYIPGVTASAEEPSQFRRCRST
jgi:hypothetical protein